MDLKETEILGDSVTQHWYYKSKAQALKKVLGLKHAVKFADVGAGSGFFSKSLLDSGMASSALCIDTSYPTESDTLYNHRPLIFRREANKIEANIVLMMDVIEHIDDDLGFLKMYSEKLTTGTKLVITVPAFQFLWSNHDIFLEHKRRYTVSSLTRLLEKTDLEIQSCSYYFGMVFPLAVATRLIERISRNASAAESQLKIHSPITNAILHLLCKLELPFMKFNKLFGLSVFCTVLKK